MLRTATVGAPRWPRCPQRRTPPTRQPPRGRSSLTSLALQAPCRRSSNSPKRSRRPAVERSPSRSTSARPRRFVRHSNAPETRLGEVDVLLYNAAMRPFGRLMETKPSTFENTWRVNAFGAFLCSQEVVPAMLAKRTGRDPLHRCYGRNAAIRDVGGVRPGEVRHARLGAGDGA